ncbi:MAG: hypothetical protein ACK5O7_02845 [Holosporales bacterium]
MNASFLLCDEDLTYDDLGSVKENSEHARVKRGASDDLELHVSKRRKFAEHQSDAFRVLPVQSIASLDVYLEEIENFLASEPNLDPASVLVLFDWDDVVTRYDYKTELYKEGGKTHQILHRMRDLGVFTRILTARGHVLQGHICHDCEWSADCPADRLKRTAMRMGDFLPQNWKKDYTPDEPVLFYVPEGDTHPYSTIMVDDIVFSANHKGESLMDLLEAHFSGSPISHIFFVDDQRAFIEEVIECLEESVRENLIKRRHPLKSLRCFHFPPFSDAAQIKQNVLVDKNARG